MLKNNSLLIFTYFCFFSVFGQTVYEISNPDQLSSLSLVAGDEVVLENGTYSSNERILFSGIGTLDNPITFRSQTPGGVIFDNGLQLDIAGTYLIVDGFYWNGGYGASNFIQFRNGTSYAQNCTIQNCAINGLTAEPGDAAEAEAEGSIIKHRWIVLYGSYNSVLNCSFMNKNTAGALVLAEYEYNASPDDGVTNTRCVEVGHTISNNYFFNYGKIDATLSNAGDSETIRIGTSEYQNVNSAATISGNYFVQSDGENEIITNKSMNNSYLNNTFRRCRGSLVMRHGSNATVEGNYFLGENVEGTGAIRIADSNHIISNNYIQDCVNIDSQSNWNNGLTFVGGNTSSVQDCNSTSVSNAYQNVDNITFSNNTIINTNSPFLFNDTRDGASIVEGTVSNNLIYFESGNANLSNIIMESDSGTSYNEIGTELTFSGNVYAGTSLGIDGVNGFSAEEIVLTANGEIFNHNQTGKGATLGEGPLTDQMVGYGVGACFLDFEANYITDSDCAVDVVEPSDTLIVNSVSAFLANGGNATTNVSSNISWTATPSDSWISINPTEAEGTSMVTVSVTENTTFDTRVGSITFNQVDGELERVLTITQEGVDVVDTLNLINSGVNGSPVTVTEFTSEEVNDIDKFNYATNTLDKDINTNWAAQGLGEFIVYDLGDTYSLDLIQIATSNKTNPYRFQIWVSTTTNEEASYTMVLPETGDYIFGAIASTDYADFEINAEAKFVKIIGFGRADSEWNAITEINFYGEQTTLSSPEFISAEALNISFYPNPVKEGILNFASPKENFDTIAIYNLLGSKVYSGIFSKQINTLNFTSGLYFVELSNDKNRVISRVLIE